MKSKEVVRLLQEIDPEGECEVTFGGDIEFFLRLPYYYDGRASIFIKDSDGNIIGMREATATDGDKIVGYVKTIEDMGWEEIERNEHGETEFQYIIEGDEHYRKRYENHRQDAIKCFEDLKNK